MAALTEDRTHDAVTLGALRQVQVPLKVDEVVYEGAMVSLLAADGFGVVAGTASSGPVVGVAQTRADATGDASDGDTSVNLLVGAFWRPNSGTAACTQAHVMQTVYAEDDQTIRNDDDTGTKFPAGICLGIDTKLGVLVAINPAVNANLT